MSVVAGVLNIVVSRRDCDKGRSRIIRSVIEDEPLMELVPVVLQEMDNAI